MFLEKFIKFGLIGSIGVVIDFSVTWLCKEKLLWNKYVSSSVGFIFAVINNYLLNRQFTFQSNDVHVTLQFTKFFLVSITALALSNGLLLIFQKYTRLNFYICKLMVILLLFVFNFWVNSIFTFA